MFAINKRLLISLFLFLIVIFVSLTAQWISPYPLDYSENLIIEEPDQTYIYAPHPPSKIHLLGTNRWGYDMLTLLLHGTKFSLYTPLLSALIAVSISFFLSASRIKYGSNEVEGQVTTLGLFSAIPRFLLIYLILRISTINSPLSVMQLLLFQSVIITMFAIPGIYHTIYVKISQLMKSEFVEAATLTGASRWYITRKHIFPMLKEDLLLQLFHETIQFLIVLGQLGLFDIFLGGTFYTNDPPLYHSVSHEWAGLIGQSRGALVTHHWWIAVFPLIFYILLLAILYNVKGGLDKEFEKRYHR